MNINKGLFLDGYTGDKPHGAWEYGKNVLLADGFKSVRNEKGFDLMVSGAAITSMLTFSGSYTYSDSKVVGHEYVKDAIILYCWGLIGGNDGAAILQYNIPTDTYEMIMEDDGTNIVFDPDLVMDSMHTYSPSGELIIAFCNGVSDEAIEPMLMNVDKRNEYYLDNNQVLYLSLLYMFNRTDHVIESYSVIDDGNLDTGVYYCTIRFEYLDGTKSNWCMLTQPIKIGANPDKPGKSSINLRGSYTGNYAYKAIDVAYIKKHNGEVFAYEYKTFDITTTNNAGVFTYKFDVNITDNSNTLVDLDSLLVRKAFYRKAGSIEFTDNKIHLAEIKEENLFLNYNKFAEDIVVGYDWVLGHKDDGARNTFAPGEVYALYVFFVLKGSGVIAQPFNIPGRPDYWDEGGDYQSVISITDGGGGLVIMEVTGHGYATNDYIEITNNTTYEGKYTISFISVDLFSITATYSSGGTATARRVNFKQFEDSHASDFFGVGLTVDTVLDYSAFPSNKRVTVDVVTYGLGGGEQVFNIVTDLQILASFTTDLRSAIDTVFTAETISIATTANTADTITFQHLLDEFNGTHFRYTLKEESDDTDLTERYNDIIAINRDYEHAMVGARPAKGFNWMSYWENDPNDGQGNHHRFPPLKDFVSGFVSSVPVSWQEDFGVSRYALLGLKLENIVIPSEIADRVQYMGFAYAKRTSENKMFFGDSLMLNYHGIGLSETRPTPLNCLLVDNYNEYADATPTSSYNNKTKLYLDNFDILHNNLRAKITNIVPEYTIDYNSLQFNTYRCTNPTTLEGVRGTMIAANDQRNTKSYASLTGFSGNMEVDYNVIIPHNSVFDPNITNDLGEHFFNSFEFFDFNWNFGGRPKPVAGTNTINVIDNTGGQKHMYLSLKDFYDFEITATNKVALTSSDRFLLDKNLTQYSFEQDTNLADATNDGFIQSGADIKIGVASIYGMKDSVYIDPKAQEIIPCGRLIEITGPGIYDFDLNDLGDCVVSEKHTLFTGDPYLDKIDEYVPTRAALNSLTHADARNQLRNNAEASSMVMGNKISFAHLTYGISDLFRTYRDDDSDPQSNVILLDGRTFEAKEHNLYEPPTLKYSNDYNAIQDLDIPLFLRETPEFNLNKIIRGTNYKNEDLDISALKTFLVDDYYIMPGDKKNIIGLSKIGEDLVIQQRYGLYFAFIKDYLSLQGTNAYLGTGELFDRKPKEIKSGEVDSISCAHKLSMCLTKYGYVVFDDVTKQLHLFNGQKQMTLTDQNGEAYFRENYDFTNLEYNPLKDTGNGVQLHYDGKNKNLHIIKKLSSGANNNLSFSFLINNFLSFHSWIPNSAIAVEGNLFSIGGNKIYRHNSSTRVARYYDPNDIEQSFIDIIFNGGEQNKEIGKLFESINWESQAIKLSDGTNEYNKTFDDILIYNDDQCSGYIALADTDWFNKVKRSIIKTWTFNEFRDLVDNNLAPFFTDNEPNANVTPNKNWFNKSMFTGKHIVVRFRTDNGVSSNQFALIINNMSVNAKINKR